MTDQKSTQTEDRSLTAKRREVLGALAATGALGAVGTAAGDVNVGGGDMSDELAHLNVQWYEGPESDVPDPGIEGRYFQVTEGDSLWEAGDVLEDRGDQWRKIDIGVGEATAESIHTESLDSKQGAVGGDIPITPLSITTDYDQDPNLAQLSDGTVVLVSREGTTHGVSDGRLVCQRSTDLGVSWSDKIEVVNEGQDDRNPSLVHDPDSGRLIVFYRSYDSGGSLEGIYFVTSDDGGQSWSSRSQLSTTYTAVCPFGSGIQTSNGLMTCVVSENGSGDRVIEAVFSTDGGQSWGSNVELINATDVSWSSGNVISEPVPARVDDNRLLCFVRDDRRSGEYGGHIVIKSDDGGATWGTRTYINPLVNDYATFLRVRTVANQLVGIAGVRGPNQESEPIRAFEIPAELAYQDPKKMGTHSEITELAETVGSDGRHTGYPDILLTSNSLDGALVAYMDDTNDNGEPDIYVGSYSSGESGRQLFDHCIATPSERVTVDSGTWTTVPYDVAEEDENGGLDTSAGTYTAQQDGLYHIWAQAHPAGSPFTSGDRLLIRLRKNSTEINRIDDNVSGPDGFTTRVDCWEWLSKRDEIEVDVFQESGGQLDITTSERTHFQITQTRR